MREFEVTLRSINPFETPLPKYKRMVIPAEDKEQVREFWATAENLPKFRGMEIDEITELPV